MSKDQICHVAATSFHDEIGSSAYPLEEGRYWLFTSKLCPFAHRTEIVRTHLGLETIFGLTIAGSVQTEKGWNLGEPYSGNGNIANPVAGVDRLPGIYELSEPGYSGRVSVPVLFDLKTNQIVNNESAEIIRQMDRIAQDQLQTASLYPAELQNAIDASNSFLNDELIGPIYQAGFARSQRAYDENAERVFEALRILDNRLSDGPRFLVADQATLADVHAFPHLARFDAIYHSLYRLNTSFVAGFTHISAYMKRLSAVRGFADTLDIEASKAGYFLSWNQPTEADFVPAGPAIDMRTGIARSLAA